MKQPLQASCKDEWPSHTPVNREGWWTRDHTLVLVLVVATALLLFACWRLIQPFVGPLAWALALAVVAHPVHTWLSRRTEKPGVAAGGAVLAVAILIVGPAVFVGHNLVNEAGSAVKVIQTEVESGK